MASKLLLFLLPVGAKLAQVFVARLSAEANHGSLPDSLKPYSAEIIEISNFLLPLLGQTAPVAPDVKVVG